MGKLIYGNSDISIELEDRALTHLQIVIGSKLRRSESFFLSWKDDVAVGGGHSSIWIDHSIPMYYKYSGGKTPTVNPEWIKILSDSANSGQGLVFSAEPGEARTKLPVAHV